MNILYILIGLLLGGVLCFWVLRPKLKLTQKEDLEIQKKNEEVTNSYKLILKEYDELQEKISSIQKEREDISNKLYILTENYEKADQAYLKKCSTVDKEVEKYRTKMMDLAKTKIEYDIKEKTKAEINNYNEAINHYKQEYTELLSDSAKDFQISIQKQNVELENQNELLKSLNAEIENARKIAASAVAENKRIAEEENKKDFYRLVLSQEDLDEISTLRKVHLRHKEPLNKVIWKVYYEKPYTDLIGRVVGVGTHCGIYKITNLKNNMCYIGQAVNISDRWKQHIRRGIGADTPTRNKLYPAMLSFGVENFSFEIIEECERGKLNEKEQYWQEFYHAKDYGYSIK